MANDRSFGPAMSACTDQERRFVIALLETGARDATKAAAMAGYGADTYGKGEGKSQNGTSKIAAYRLSHRPRVQAAIREEADKRIRAGAILGASVVMEIAMNPLHKDQYKAAVELMNRSGLIVETKHTVEVTDNRTTNGLLARVHELAARLQLDPRKLLGQAAGTMPVLDAEYEEVEGSSDGLEDLL